MGESQKMRAKWGTLERNEVNRKWHRVNRSTLIVIMGEQASWLEKSENKS